MGSMVRWHHHEWLVVDVHGYEPNTGMHKTLTLRRNVIVDSKRRYLDEGESKRNVPASEVELIPFEGGVVSRKPKVKIGKMLKNEGYQFHCLAPCGKCCNGGLEIPIHSYEKRRYKLKKYAGRPKVIRLDGYGNESSTGELFYQLETKEDGSCWYLKNRRCSIYNKRPEVCRGYLCHKRYDEAQAMLEKEVK